MGFSYFPLLSLPDGMGLASSGEMIFLYPSPKAPMCST